MIWWKQKQVQKDFEQPSNIPEHAPLNNEHNAPPNLQEDGKDKTITRLMHRFHLARTNFSAKIDGVLRRRRVIDPELLEELEEALITADVGINATAWLMERVSEQIKKKKLKTSDELYEVVKHELIELLNIPTPPLDPSLSKPFIIMVTGVNGVGKTTTIAKLAHYWRQKGFFPILAAADTFRAAAIEQLAIWAERIKVPIVKQQPGADPSAVAYDAVDAAISRKLDIVIIDTAGRMHTRSNLMEELKKIHRVLSKKLPGAPHEVLLVLDATTGQNALSQARLFKEAVNISGLVLTKLDGTAKGGTIIAICHELGLPIRFIGIGEDIEDLRPFDPVEFVNALLIE